MRTSATLRYLLGPVELLHAQAGPGLLRLVRIGVFALWIVKLLLDPIWRLAALPTELFHPTGLLAWLPAEIFTHPWSPELLVAFWLTTLLVLLAALTNRAFPLVSALAAILLTAYSSLIRGFGPAVHTDIILLLAVYALALFSWADGAQKKFGRTNAGDSSSYPIITIVALLCLTYCLVGLNRSIAAPRVFIGNSMEIWTIDASLRGYFFNTNIGWHLPQWPAVVFFLRLGLPVITFFEISAPLCLISSPYRWIFIPTMLSFHLLSLVLMNIFFFDDMLLYLLLIDWSRRFPALRTRDPYTA
jgi:hypothetical protein